MPPQIFRLKFSKTVFKRSYARNCHGNGKLLKIISGIWHRRIIIFKSITRSENKMGQ